MGVCQPTLPTAGVWVPAKDTLCLPPSPTNRKLGCGGKEGPLVLPSAVGAMRSVCERFPVLRHKLAHLPGTEIHVPAGSNRWVRGWYWSRD